jgi:hypothetical protein
MLVATSSSVPEQTIAACEEGLHASAFALRATADKSSPDARAAVYALVRAVTGQPESLTPLSRLREEWSGRHDVGRAAATDREFERSVILMAATEGLKQLPQARLPQSVQTLICDEMRWLASAPVSALASCGLGTSAFERLCKIATLRRFPAGVFEWEVSGIPRSYCLQTAKTDWPRVAAFVACRMKGFAPVFFSHLAPRSIGRSLQEREANRSYYQMAMALRLQPEVLGFGACSWFRAPSTHRVSPHLAWLSNVFRENGGLVVDAGLDDPNGGALYRSATRRSLYEAGKWTPRKGLVMWPRNAMLDWASRNPELNSP